MGIDLAPVRFRGGRSHRALDKLVFYWTTGVAALFRYDTQSGDAGQHEVKLVVDIRAQP
jgi:hypothetical protein